MRHKKRTSHDRVDKVGSRQSMLNNKPSFSAVFTRMVQARPTKGLLATSLFMVLFLVISSAWRLDLYRPIAYWGDALEMAAHFGRDYVFNDMRERFFAPFGVEHSSSLRYVINFLFQPNSTLFLIAYSVTGDTIASLNLYYLLTFPLAFICAYWVYGRLQLANPFRFGAATLFAMMPYHFHRSVGHLMESSYFLVPLLAYIVLLVFRERPFFHCYRDGAWRWSWKEKQDWFLLAVAVFLSQINEYHHFFFVLLLGMATSLASVQRRSFRVLAGGATLLGATLLSTGAKLALNHLVAEPGLGLSLIGTPISGYGGAEIYALKPIQVLLPVAGHHLDSLRALRGIYESAHVVNENATVSLGLLGAIGFVFLLGRGVYAVIAKRRGNTILDLCAFLTLCCVLISMIGGVSSVVATAGRILFGPESILTQIRGYNRIVVFVAFFSYYAGSVLLWLFVRRVTATVKSRFSAKLLATFVWLTFFLLAVWDQVPYRLKNPVSDTARAASDRRFFSQIEAQLQPRSLVFQYPFNIHHADVNGSLNLPYNYADGIRPYLNTHTLRFTFGGDDRSAQIKWLEEISSLPPAQMVRRLCEYNFSGIIIHRKLFKTPAGAADFEAQLSALLGLSLQESSDGEIAFAPLDGACTTAATARVDLSAESSKLLKDRSLEEGIDFAKRDYPAFLAEVSGVAGHEPWGRWTIGPSTRFRFKEPLPKQFTVEVTANAFGPNTGQPVKVRVGGAERTFIITRNSGETYHLVFETDGTADSLEIIPPKPISPAEIDPKSSDPRKLGIALHSLKIKG